MNIDLIKNLTKLHDAKILSDEALAEALKRAMKPKSHTTTITRDGVTVKDSDGAVKFKIGRIGEHDLEPVNTRPDRMIGSDTKLMGLYKPDLSSGSILPSYEYGLSGVVCGKCYYMKPFCKCVTSTAVHPMQYKKVERKNPSTLRVVEYTSGIEHAHGLPEHAREMITMIEAEEFKMFTDYSNTKDEWDRIVEIDKDGIEHIEWVKKSEATLNPELQDYEKFLASAVAEVKHEKDVPVEWDGEVVALKDVFNLHVGGVD